MVREHQISISLKPQQFELLQRLARERGYKSVSAYVREKINELALSIDDGVLQESPAGAKLEPELISDLVRIHQELKSFFDASGSAVANASPLTERLAGGTAGDLVVCRPFDVSLALYKKGQLEKLDGKPGKIGRAHV